VKTEMDLVRMDERQRLCWLKANRVTIMIIGIVWLSIIGWELLQGRTPLFMMVMVPVFGLIRFLTYKHYVGRARLEHKPG